MRDLSNNELSHVYGAGGSGCKPSKPPKCSYGSGSRGGSKGGSKGKHSGKRSGSRTYC